LKSRKKVKN